MSRKEKKIRVTVFHYSYSGKILQALELKQKQKLLITTWDNIVNVSGINNTYPANVFSELSNKASLL